MSFSIDLAGRTALVTGAGQGVGLGIAQALAAAGAEVLVNDLRDPRAAAAVQLITDAGGRARSAVFDVTDPAAVGSVIREAGGVDILVNNAGNAGVSGFGSLDPFVATTPESWEPYLQVNLYGVMHCTHAALPRMIDQKWGRIITIVSDAGRTGEAYMAAYCAAKAGAAGFGRAIAHEVARFNITSNNIALGTMKTPLAGDRITAGLSRVRLPEADDFTSELAHYVDVPRYRSRLADLRMAGGGGAWLASSAYTTFALNGWLASPVRGSPALAPLAQR